jgi:hypothetical protein
VIEILGGDRTIADSDGAEGETLSIEATATDSDGSIVSTEWLIDGNVVATGLSATLSLPDGETMVVFRATDNDGDSSSATIVVTVEPPAPDPVWPAPFNGVRPDLALGLPYNNIGLMDLSAMKLYSCIRFELNGQQSAFGGLERMDIIFDLLSADDLSLQVRDA